MGTPGVSWEDFICLHVAAHVYGVWYCKIYGHFPAPDAFCTLQQEKHPLHDAIHALLLTEIALQKWAPFNLILMMMVWRWRWNAAAHPPSYIIGKFIYNTPHVRAEWERVARCRKNTRSGDALSHCETSIHHIHDEEQKKVSFVSRQRECVRKGKNDDAEQSKCSFYYQSCAKSAIECRCARRKLIFGGARWTPHAPWESLTKGCVHQQRSEDANPWKYWRRWFLRAWKLWALG